MVIAIACERDLVSGLQDARQITVEAITNQRPPGSLVLIHKVDLDRRLKRSGLLCWMQVISAAPYSLKG